MNLTLILLYLILIWLATNCAIYCSCVLIRTKNVFSTSSHESSNLARRGTLVFTWALIWPASLSENQLPWSHKDFPLRLNFLSSKGKPREKGKTCHLKDSRENSRLGNTILLSIFLEKVGCSAWVGFCNSLDTLAVCSMNEHFFTSVHW